MKSLFVAAAFACTFGVGAAFAQDPVTGAVERFFTLEPGGSAPETPYQFGGDKCDGVPQGAQVWWGRFAGGRNNGPSGNDGRKITHTSEGCFPSEGACESWMLALKTRYSAKPIYNHCQFGYDPGAPVPPWWAPRS